jgi:hypothetical protein
MLMVAGLPRTGTTFMMELLHHLGRRIPYDWQEKWRGGHESPEYNRLAIDLGRWMMFPFPSDLSGIAADGAVIQSAMEGADISYTSAEIHQVLQDLWGRYDALKDVAEGHLMMLAQHLGWAVTGLIIMVRDLGEIYAKYGQIPVHVPARQRTPQAGYAVWGLLLHWAVTQKIPYVVGAYPQITQSPEYAYDLLKDFVPVGWPAFREGWEKAHR